MQYPPQRVFAVYKMARPKPNNRRYNFDQKKILKLKEKYVFFEKKKMQQISKLCVRFMFMIMKSQTPVMFTT